MAKVLKDVPTVAYIKKVFNNWIENDAIDIDDIENLIKYLENKVIELESYEEL